MVVIHWFYMLSGDRCRASSYCYDRSLVGWYDFILVYVYAFFPRTFRLPSAVIF